MNVCKVKDEKRFVFKAVWSVYDSGTQVAFAFKLTFFKSAYSVEERSFSNNSSERIFGLLATDELKGNLVHIMNGKVSKCRRNTHGVS